MIHHGVLILLRSHRKILLIQRGNIEIFPHMYTLPSGKVDLGESARQAAIREAKEEVGVTIKEYALQLAHLMHRRKENGEIWIDFFFVCDEWGGDPLINEPDKFTRLDWFVCTKLPGSAIPFVRHGIEKINENSIYSEFGF